jgi:IMP dehydrogenase
MKYLVVLDNLERLIKLAFKQDIDTIKIGAATDTYIGWRKRVDKVINTGVDLIVIDSSDAFNENIIDAVKEYKSNYKVPLCVGNVITYDGAMALMEAGADLVKEGMSSGSICTTQKVKATGRGPMTSLLETVRARDDYFKKSGRYVSVIADGGITGSADMIIALAGGADLLIMGNYFNKFYEAAGPKLDENKKQTNNETKIRYVETWGEGSERARNLGRYGHSHRRTFFAEGAEGFVSYAGRLKPNIERDMQIVKAALSNIGAMNLDEFRKKAVLELNSIHTSSIVSNIHDINTK